MVLGASSMTVPSDERLSPLHAADLTYEGQALFSQLLDTLSRTPASVAKIYVNADGTLGGPFNAMLLSPAVGEAMQNLGSVIQAATTLSVQERELAVLALAYELDSEFISAAHTAIGAGLGLDVADMAWAAGGLTERTTEPAVVAVVAVTRALIRDGDLDDEKFFDARAVLGECKLFELSSLVGYYSMLALQLRLFRVSIPS
jgi:4-carboxymuconolactone decarboxylase